MVLTAKRLRAWVALAAFLGSVGLPFVSASHMLADDDAACGQVSLVNHHPVVQFERSTPASPLEHCAICHWQRAVSGASTSARVTAALSLESSLAEAPERTRALGRGAPDTRSSRAPPALFS